jgi:sec-independent protein translocase protein TatA
MTVANLLGALDGPDLLIILVIVLVLFGGAKLPQLARSLGEAKHEFHKATNAGPVSSDQPDDVPAGPNPDENGHTQQAPGATDLPS